jgi:archaemetzincin
MNLPAIMYYFVAAMCLCSCVQNEPAKSVDEPLSVINRPTNELVISIQPFDDLSEKYLEYVVRELRKVYPRVSVQPPIKLPLSALNHSGIKYRADSLISFLRNRSDGLKYEHVTLGLTSKDVSVTRGQTTDCCIMGLAYRPGKACVASLYRLKSSNKSANFFKLAVHELGHTQGLYHCHERTCLMRATKKNHFDELTGFCPRCKEILKKAGWVLK